MAVKRTGRRLFTERLERRELLAGDVSVSVVSGDLVVTGDAADNYLFIWQDGSGDWVVSGGRQLVSGAPQTGTETLINSLSGAQTFSGVTGGLMINLGLGNDQVEISNGQVLGPSVIDLGDGDNQLILTTGFTLADPGFEVNDGSSPVRGPLDFAGNLSISAGTGNDQVYVDIAATMQADVNFTSGAGDDFLQLSGTGTWNVGGSVDIDFGAGDDVFNSEFNAINVTGDFTVVQGDTATATGAKVWLIDATVGGTISVTGAAGHNFVQLENVTATTITLDLGDGADEVDTLNVSVTDFTADLGAGDDRDSWFETITATNQIQILTGAGEDVVPLQTINALTLIVSTGDDGDGVTAFDVTATTVSFDTGAGADVIGVYRVQATDLDVLTGDGDDGGGFIFGLVVGSSTITGTLTVNSGAGLNNVLLGSVTAAITNLQTGAQSDGVIIMFSDLDDMTLDTSDEIDVVGIYDTVFNNLDVLLGSGLDDFWLGNVTTNGSANLDGQVDGANVHEPTANSFTGRTDTNLTAVT
jgi:hypothetical protein